MLSTEVKFSYLIDRIDANFYITQIKTLEELETSSIPEKGSMEQLCTFPRSRTPGRYDYTERGIPVIKLKNITDYFIDLNDTSFIPERLYLNYIQPKEGDILITATGEGTIGRVGIFKDSIKCIVTGEVMIVRVKKDKINPYFLFSYLRSKYGKPLIIRFVRGSTGQTHLYSKDVKFISVLIPLRSFQEKIENLVIVAHEKRNLADQKYEKARHFLYKELDISRLKLKEEKTFESSFSEIKETMRFDSEYYQPKYTEVKSKLIKFSNNYDVVELKQIVTLTTGKQQETFKKLTDGMPFYSIKDIEKSTLSKANVRYIRKNDHIKMKNSELKINDILLAITGATIGKTGIFLENRGNISGDLARIRIKDNFKWKINAFYILVYLESLFGQLQINRDIYGATNKHLSLKSVEKFLIPILPRPKQEEISKLVKESFSLRKESKKLLERAKKEVEKMIENSTNPPLHPQKNS